MYGVDVISCLNKALSNYDDSYEIKVDVNLKETNKKLKQSITFYYWKYDDRQKKVVEFTEDNPDSNLKFNNVTNFNVLKNEAYMKDWAKFKKDDKAESLIEETEVDLKLDKSTSLPGQKIYNLLSFSKVISENIKNYNSDAKYAIIKLTSPSDYYSKNGWNKLWIKLEFKSYLYDLKTRKFKCDSITYKSDSGRVDEIIFTEV